MNTDNLTNIDQTHKQLKQEFNTHRIPLTEEHWELEEYSIHKDSVQTYMPRVKDKYNCDDSCTIAGVYWKGNQLLVRIGRTLADQYGKEEACLIAEKYFENPDVVLAGIRYPDLAPRYKFNYLIFYWAYMNLYIPYKEAKVNNQNDTLEYEENGIQVREYSLNDNEYVTSHSSFDSLLDDLASNICILEASPNVGKTVAIKEIFQLAIEQNVRCYIVLPTKAILSAKMAEYKDDIIDIKRAKRLSTENEAFPSCGIMIWDTFSYLYKSFSEYFLSGWLLFDEVHNLVTSISYRESAISGIGDLVKKKTSRLLFATATPLGENDVFPKEHCIIYRYVKNNATKYTFHPVFIDTESQQRALMSYVRDEYGRLLENNKSIDCVLVYDNHNFDDWCGEYGDFLHFCAPNHPLYCEGVNEYIQEGPYQNCMGIVATKYLSEGIDLHYKHPIIFIPMNHFISMYEVIQVCHRFRIESVTEVDVYVIQSNEKCSTREYMLAQRMDAYTEKQLKYGVANVQVSTLDQWKQNQWTPASIKKQVYDEESPLGKWHKLFLSELQCPVCAYMADSIALMMKNMGDINCMVQPAIQVDDTDLPESLCPYQIALQQLEEIMTNGKNQQILGISFHEQDRSKINELKSFSGTIYKQTSQLIDDLEYTYSCHWRFYYDALKYANIEGKISSTIIKRLVSALKFWDSSARNTTMGEELLTEKELKNLTASKRNMEFWISKLQLYDHKFSYGLPSFIAKQKTSSIKDIIYKFYQNHPNAFIFITEHYVPDSKVNHKHSVKIKDKINNKEFYFDSKKECITYFGWSERESRSFFARLPNARLNESYELID